mmetsp:Transcript_30046/g.43937  ORF Transcript_30046/g.43937 Transcript_30046/m.43937 type:complete len:215 (-) Transcript_30046:357-1001(-)
MMATCPLAIRQALELTVKAHAKRRQTSQNQCQTTYTRYWVPRSPPARMTLKRPIAEQRSSTTPTRTQTIERGQRLASNASPRHTRSCPIRQHESATTPYAVWATTHTKGPKLSNPRSARPKRCGVTCLEMTILTPSSGGGIRFGASAQVDTSSKSGVATCNNFGPTVSAWAGKSARQLTASLSSKSRAGPRRARCPTLIARSQAVASPAVSSAF